MKDIQFIVNIDGMGILSQLEIDGEVVLDCGSLFPKNVKEDDVVKAVQLLTSKLIDILKDKGLKDDTTPA